MKKSKPEPMMILVIVGAITFVLMLVSIFFMATRTNNPYPNYYNTGEINDN